MLQLEDIEIVCGRGRSTGVGAKYMDDAVEIMIEQGEKWWILLLHNNTSTFGIDKLCNWAFPKKKKVEKVHFEIIFQFEILNVVKKKKKIPCILGTLSKIF